MKIKGTPTSKKNLCPVCGNHHGCKIQEDKWILCLRASSQQDAPPNYRFVKPLRNGMGGLFVRDDGRDNWNEEQRVTRRQEQELKRRQREREQAQRRAFLLSISERDHQYRLVNQNLTLIARQRQVLRERGLTDFEIDLVVELGAVRTWNPGQRILGISPDLAGVEPFTRGLVGVDGIAIYALDPDGNITGAQLKTDNQKLGKYIWLSSASKDGNGPQLPNGELPLFSWKHPDAKTINEVWLCEGGLKSLIVALKLWSFGRTDIAVIGTASAARYGEQTLKDYLKRLRTKSIQLMPDAGSAVNSDISQANQNTIRHLRKWGYSVHIGDWGQLFDKTQLDIDELLVTGRWAEIQTISPDTFFQIHPERERLPQLHPDTIEEVKLRADADIVDVIGQRISLTKRGKDFVGDCPFHNDKKFSLSVSPDKQLHQCLSCGASGSAIKFLMELDKRAFTDVVLDLAQRYQLSARWADGTPISDDTLRERTISPDEWEFKFGLPNWFKGQLNRLSKVFKGFGSKPKPPQTSASNPEHPLPKPQPKIYYTPGKLPTRENYHKIGCPKIQFAPGERLQLIAELVALGYHDILDSSATGTSKSHDAGLAEPERFGVDRLWYFSQDHRNPTTHTVEANYRDMPVRNDGMFIDSSRKTALNNPHERWPKQGETATTQGNCFRTPLFHTLAAKGYENEAGTEAGLNIICLNCHRGKDCGTEDRSGPGASFRNDRKEVFASSDRLRASLDSCLSPKDLLPKVKNSQNGEEIVSNRNAAFIDEAMRHLKPTSIVEARLSDFDQVFAEIESKLPDVHEALKPFRLALRPILAGEVAPSRETYHGWSDAALRDVLGEFRESLFDDNSSTTLADIITQLKSIQPKLDEILKEPDGFTKGGIAAKDRKGVSNDTSKFIRSRVRQDSYREMTDNLRALAANWLIPFLEVWSGSQRGALRIDYGVLSVTTRNTRHAEVCKAMQWVVYLDATADRRYLAQYLDIDPSDIVQIEQEPARVENLTIVQVIGFGLAGHDRSDSLLARIAALRPALTYRHHDIRFLDHKKHAQAESGDGWWFNHNRGSNEYKTLSAIASFGTPYQDIGSLQDLWLTLTGDRNVDRDAPGFSAFVQWQTQSEFAQAVGRLRANLRPDQALTYYSCTDFDLGFLREYYPGATIRQESAFSITPEAGTQTEQSHWRIQQNILDYAKQTGIALEKLTQVAAARAAGVSQGRISQVAAHFGGWGDFKKILALLLDVSYRTANNFEPLAEDQQFIADTYLPLAAEEDPKDAVEAMLNTAKAYGWRVFQAILAATSIETRGRLLAALIGGLPPALQDEFKAIALLTPG